MSFVNPSRLYFVTQNQLLQRLTEFVIYKYNFYTGELVIYLSLIKAGVNSGDNWSTKPSGTAASCWRYRRTTPVALAPAADMYQKRIDKRKQNFSVSIAATKITLT